MLSFMSRLALIFLCGLGFLSRPVLAQDQALPQVCNETAGEVLLALALDVEGHVYSRGWISLGAGQCAQELLEFFEDQTWVVSDQSALHLHVRDRLSRPGLSLGQGLELCVDDVFDEFWVEFADSTCAKRGYVRASFSAFDLSDVSSQISIRRSGFDTL